MNNERKKLGTGTIVLLVVVAVVLIFGGMVVGKYNGLVSAQEKVDAQFSNISAQLQRRNDLIPNLVNTVKAYAKHEEEVFTAVTEARAQIMGATNKDDIVNADQQMTAAVTNLIAVAESYPELKASGNFKDLQNQLAGTENRIAVARKDYNEAVKAYNTTLRSFPGNIIGGMFGFKPYQLFQATPGADQVPDVDIEQ